uniref:M23 family metallopeptidase n=1 Tax=Phenylobacterium glaciei TaxID=2803784 RepID=A0A974SAG5_9CAUL|nr:M23 family metallopeptidase [Phenylobacterium glaciei]
MRQSGPRREDQFPFGLRRLPWEDHGRLHEGVDIAGPTGTKVLAVSDGIVKRAGESPSYGRYVEVEHGVGLTSFYAHLGKIERGVKRAPMWRPARAWAVWAPVARRRALTSTSRSARTASR